MYVADPRFAAAYEKIRPGMAEYMRDVAAVGVHTSGVGKQSAKYTIQIYRK